VYADRVLKNVTITLPEEVLWARKRLPKKTLPLPRLVGKMLEAQMRQTDDYQDAWRRWQNLSAWIWMPNIDCRATTVMPQIASSSTPTFRHSVKRCLPERSSAERLGV
jgi:hypothetical protein